MTALDSQGPPVTQGAVAQDVDVIHQAARSAVTLGYRIVALHGVRADGACTCRRGASCSAPGKHPLARNWQKDSGSLQDFRRNADIRSAVNLGLRLDADAPVPLVLVDVDTKHGKPGASSFAQLEAECGPLPNSALLQRTPTGGSHYLLRLPEGVDPRTLSTGTDVLPGLDVFTHRRQFVISPSRTAAGAYSFVDVGRGLPAPSALPLIPSTWLERLREPYAVRGGSSHGDVASETPDIAPDPAIIVRLLDLLPAPAENTRDECVDFAFALHGALANADPDLVTATGEAFLRWAGRWPGANPEHDHQIWESTDGARHRGWRHVLDDARLFIDRGRAAPTAERGGVIDGADLKAALTMLDQIRSEEAQADFEAVPDATPPAPTTAASSLTVRSFAEVRPKPIEWLLPGRVARQQITMVNGWPGEGKTSVVIDIAARMTRSQALPDGSVPPRPLRVMFLSTEDSESILHLRLRAAGADMGRVFTIPDTQLHRLTLPANKATWVQLLQEHKIDVVVVDPMKAFLDNGLKDIAEQDARRFMLALRQACEVTDAAAICIRHPNKATAAGHSTAISAASGSLGFTAAARIELLVGRMPDDEETRALVHVKNNLAKPPVALLYRIVSQDVSFEEDSTTTQDVAAIEWKGADDKVLADELLAKRQGREERSKLEEAADFLRNFLAAGPAEHTLVRSAARQHGIARRTLERARLQVGWTAIKGNLRGGGKSIWGLNNQSPEDFAGDDPASISGSGGTPPEESVLEPADLSDLETTATRAPENRERASRTTSRSTHPSSGEMKAVPRKRTKRRGVHFANMAK